MSEWAFGGVGWVVMVGAQWSVAGRCVWEFQRIAAETLLIEEILHQLICSLSHYFQGFVHPRWCRISSINWEVFGFKHCLVLHPADHPH